MNYDEERAKALADYDLIEGALKSAQEKGITLSQALTIQTLAGIQASMTLIALELRRIGDKEGS